MEVKNTIAIESIPIIMPEPDDVDMELPVSLAIDIADVVVVGEPDPDMAIPIPLILEPGIDIVLLSMLVVGWYQLFNTQDNITNRFSNL